MDLNQKVEKAMNELIRCGAEYEMICWKGEINYIESRVEEIKNIIRQEIESLYQSNLLWFNEAQKINQERINLEKIVADYREIFYNLPRVE